MNARSNRWWWVLADVASILVFVAMGRSTHAEGLTLGGIAVTALPFLIALGLAWAVPAVNSEPLSPRAGLIVWLVVIVIGMLLRRLLFDDGIAPAFIIVATVFLGFALNGWRAFARALRNHTSSDASE